MVDFSQAFLSLSVLITLFFHPKKPPVSQAYFLFASQNAIPFLIPSLPKTHSLLPLLLLLLLSRFSRVRLCWTP